MSLIYVLNDASTIPLSTANHVVEKLVVRGHNGHHGHYVQKHVVVENGHVKEPLHGTMLALSSMLTRKTVIQVMSGGHGDHH